MKSNWKNICFAICVLLICIPYGLRAQNIDAEYSSYTNENGLSGKNINCILEDWKGFLWVGTNGGLNKFDGYKFTVYHSIPNDSTTLSGDFITSLSEDAKGYLWIATKDGGVNKFDRHTESFYRYKNNASDDNSMAGNSINSMCIDEFGNVWIGTNKGGLIELENNSQNFISFRHRKSNPNTVCSDNVLKIIYIGNSRLLIATDDGLSLFDFKNNVFKNFTHSEKDNISLHNNYVGAIFRDLSNQLWIGTSNLGFQKFNAGTGEFTTYNFPAYLINSSNQDFINCITEDKSGNLLLSFSSGNGILQFNKSRSEFILINSGFPAGDKNTDISINCIFCDRSNVLWSGTNNSRLDKIIIYNNGINVTNNYQSLSDSGKNSIIAVTSFNIISDSASFIKNISELKEVNLTHNENSFLIEFSLLDFVNPEQNLYSYKMSGIEKEWTTPGVNRSAKYTNLDPGEYTFLVKAANNNKIWTEPISLKINITSPFWRTWIFYTILSTLLVLTVVVLTRELVKHKKRNKLLNVYLTDWSTELEKINRSLQNEFKKRQKVEESLRNSEMEYRLLVENANEAIIVVQDDRVVFTNSKTNEIIDFPLQDLSIESLFYHIHPEDKEKVINIFQSRKKNEDASGQYRIIRNDRMTVHIDIKRVNIQWKGRPAVLYFVTDITDRKRAEDDIKKALEKEKELSELRSRFISMTSHEFRTPLTSIFTSSELLDKYSKELSEEQKKKNLLRIQKNAQQMTRLLNEVLILGRSDSGMLKLKPEPVDVNQLCTELLDEFQSYIKYQTKHKLTLELEKSTGKVMLDYNLMKQSLENLISNAIKYSGIDSNILFKVSYSEKFIDFRVKDEGIGIPQEDINNLFEPFFRAGNTGNISGSGLGLAIVKRAVELHNGGINVISKVGEGSEFIISIPLIKAV